MLGKAWNSKGDGEGRDGFVIKTFKPGNVYYSSPPAQRAARVGAGITT
jgi:hypothetical protein